MNIDDDDDDEWWWEKKCVSDVIWFRRRLNRRRWRARQRARARDKHIKSPNENSTSKNIPKKKNETFSS